MNSKYIKGIGVDITKVNRFFNLINKYEKNFTHKVLHLKEINEYHKLTSINMKAKFLASRWSYKEAIVKASGNKQLIFSKIYLEKNLDGIAYLSRYRQTLC
jgi:phosphopantetheine--protein transferase-like protein